MHGVGSTIFIALQFCQNNLGFNFPKITWNLIFPNLVITSTSGAIFEELHLGSADCPAKSFKLVHVKTLKSDACSTIDLKL